MREIERDIVSGVIISGDDKVLLGLGRQGSVYSDTWRIPGGGMEEGETKLQTLAREVCEESGLDVSGSDEPTLVEDGLAGESEKTLPETGERVLVHMRFYTYLVRLAETADNLPLDPSDELAEVKWAPISELAQYKLTPPAERLFAEMEYLVPSNTQEGAH